MALIIQIGLGVVFIFSIVAAIMAGKVWGAVHVVLVWLIAVSAGVFWFYASATLSYHNKFRNEAQILEKKIRRVSNEIDELKNGDREYSPAIAMDHTLDFQKASVNDLETELFRWTNDQGRWWEQCQPTSIQNNQVSVAIPQPKEPKKDGDNEPPLPEDIKAQPHIFSPHNIVEGMILFVIEDRLSRPARVKTATTIEDGYNKYYDYSAGGRYLGEFKVISINGNTIQLQPSRKLTPPEIRNLTTSVNRKINWVLYETMPSDRHDVFVGVSKEDLALTIPKSLPGSGLDSALDEYLKDGKPAVDDDPEERKEGYKADGLIALPDESTEIVKTLYRRRLRDYAGAFVRYHKRRIEYNNMIESLNTTEEKLDSSHKAVKKDIAYRKDEKDKLTSDKLKFQEEAKLVSDHLAALKSHDGKLDQQIQVVSADNTQIASQYAKIQLELTEQINKRSQPVPATGGSLLNQLPALQ